MNRLVFTLALAGSLVCLLVLVMASLPSCGKSKPSPANITTARDALPGRNVAATPKVPPLGEMLQQLRELERPPQASPELWVSLRQELKERLIERFGSGKGTSSYPPTGGEPHDYVKARDLTWKPSGTYGKLEWRYVNDGDYDQSGEVDIADVTPIAVLHGEVESVV